MSGRGFALRVLSTLPGGTTQAQADDMSVGRRIAQQGVLAGDAGCAACHL